MQLGIKFPIIYNNGNYQVTILEDGTKTRVCFDDEWSPVLPETIDVNISNHCEHNCPFCYISASSEGKHGNLNLEIFNTLRKGTELAINYAKHPGLFNFLLRMQEKQVIVNMTANQKDLENEETRKFIKMLLDMKLIMGLGVSVNSIDKLYYIDNPNIVYHVIAGITPIIAIECLITDKEKILILGYKTKGRGKEVTPRLERIQEEIKRLLILNESIISFDNLALQQLDIKSIVKPKVWEKHYMGEEGSFSMYIDTVDERYYVASIEEQGYPISVKTLKQMFSHVTLIKE